MKRPQILFYAHLHNTVRVVVCEAGLHLARLRLGALFAPLEAKRPDF